MATRNTRNETAARIGEAIRRARMSRGLTQLDLARMLQVERTTVTGWESGRRTPDVPTLERIAGALGMQPHEMLRPEGAPAEHHPSAEEQLRQLRALLRGMGATDEDVRLILHVLRVRQREIQEREERGGTKV